MAIYYDFLNWGLGQSDPRFGVWFAIQPDWLILQTWTELKKRKAEDANALSYTGAQICAIALNALSAFGGSKSSETAMPNKFLPFQLPDDNSPAAQWKRKLKPSTIRIMAELVEAGKVPPGVTRSLQGVPGLIEVLEGSV